MAVPKYDEMYRQFLDCLVDGRVHKSKEVKDEIAKAMGVTEKDRREMLQSGRQPVFDNRVGWARTYLNKAGLIESPARGCYQLTKIGRGVLSKNPAVIDNHYLERFESFKAFVSNAAQPENKPSAVPATGQSPQDIFDSAYSQINAALADDLLAEVMKQPPAFFENLVINLLLKMGYGNLLDGAGKVVGQSGDEGIDGIIREDKLGFNLIYIQAKRWDCDTTIGRPEIQKFVGALAGQGASKGLFISTAQFTKEARAYAGKQHTTKVVLVDGTMLTKLMIEYNLGVSTETTYEIKRLDTDFFSTDAD